MKKLFYQKISVILAAAMLIQPAFSFQAQAAPMDQEQTESTGKEPMLEVDYRSLVSQADMSFDSPITKGTAGIPLGNGTMGSMVWTPQEQQLRMQINRVDVYRQNGASNSGAQQAENDMYGACGNIAVDFGSGIFKPGSTMQHLSYYDALETIEAGGVKARIFADREKDVFVLNITDERPEPAEIQIDLSTIFPDLTDIKGNNTLVSTLIQEKDKIILTQEMSEACDTGITENDYYCSSAVAIGVEGREIVTGKADDTRLRISVPAENGSFTVYIGSAASMDRNDQVKERAAGLVSEAAQQGFEMQLSAHKAAWHDYWSQSYMYFPGVNGTGYGEDYGLHWLHYYYIAGSSFGGKYPAKFNGLVFNTNNGSAAWGSKHWYFNQGRAYYAMETGNHPELLDPFLNMKTENYGMYEIAAKQQWNSKGIFVSETESFSGPEILPENIAEQLADCKLNGKVHDGELMDFIHRRNRLEARWEVDPSSGYRTGYVTNIVYNGADMANMFWDRYLYTGDEEWLRERAYPMLKGVAEFYRNFPNLKKGEDGKYHIYKTAFAETLWGADDVINDLNWMRGLLPTAIRAAQILNVDSGLIPLWQEVLDNLAPNPMSSEADALLKRTHPEGKTTYAIGRAPCIFQLQSNPSVWDEYQIELLGFDQVNLETRARGINDEAWEINMNTLESQEAYQCYQKGTSPSVFGSDGASWSRYMTDCARMGRSDLVKLGLTSHMRFWKANLSRIPNRLSTDNQAEGVSIQEDGVFAEGMQNALLQSLAPGAGSEESVIYVFGAWPEDIDAAFKLAAKKGFLVSSSQQNGTIEFVELESRLGETCQINNPWGEDQKVDIYRNGVKDNAVLSGRLLEFKTSRDETIVLVKTGENPDDYRREIGYAAPISVSGPSSLTVGETGQVEVASEDSLDGIPLSFESSAPYVAAVDGTGAVKALEPGSTTISVTASFPRGDSKAEFELDVTVAGSIYLSDLEWTSAVSGWGEIQKDKAVAEGTANDPIKIGDKIFKKGLGTHAPSEINYELDGRYKYFNATIGVGNNPGVDDRASVVFQVFADEEKVYDSGVMGKNTAAKNINLVISDVNVLKLVVTDAGDGKACDHANWANAMIYPDDMVFNDNAQEAVYSGDGWSYAADRESLGDWAGDVHQTESDGAYVEFHFNGTGIEYIGPKNRNLAEMNIYIDGEFMETIDADTPDSKVYTPQQLLYSKKDLPAGSHSIKVEKKSREWMVIDAFRVYNDQTDYLLSDARRKAEAALVAYEASNASTAEEVLALVEEAISNSGIGLSWAEEFNLAEATIDTAGRVTGKVALSMDGKSAEAVLDKEIEPLSIGILEEARIDAEMALAAYIALNESTADEVLAIVVDAMNNADIMVNWTGEFVLAPATYDEAGRITGTITISLGGKDVEISLDKKIAKLLPYTVYNDSAPEAVYTGSDWSYAADRGSLGDWDADVHQTVSDGDCVEFGFHGTGIEYIGPKNQNLAEMNIYIDGEYVETIDAHTPDKRVYTAQQLLYSNKDLPEDDHTIKIEKKSREWMVIDAFRVYNDQSGRLLAEAAERVKAGLAAFEASNATTAEEVLAAVTAAVNHEDIAADWTAVFELAEATFEAAGRITGTVSLFHSEKKVDIPLDMAIPQLTGVQKIIASPGAMELKAGQQGTITLTFEPENASDKTVEWSSSNPEAATVSGGDVIAVGEGTATITASWKYNKEISASCTVSVRSENPPAGNTYRDLLQMTYDYAKNLSTEGVVDSAAKKFQDALAQAKSLLENPGATDTQLEESFDELLAGIWGLGLTKGDKTELQFLIAKADIMVGNQDKYVAGKWTLLVESLANANAVMKDGDAMTEEIKTAADELLNAILQQRFKARKDILEGILNRAEKVDETLYTEKSVQVFRTAFVYAKGIMANDDLSEDDQPVVDKAAEKLDEAIVKLEKKEEPSEPTNPDEPSGPSEPSVPDTPSDDNSQPSEDGTDTSADSTAPAAGSSTSDGQDGNIVSPKTGDYAGIGLGALIAVLGILCVGGAVVVKRKREG